MSDELPTGWTETEFFDFCVLQRGYDLPLSQVKDGPFPVVTSAGIVARHAEFKSRAPGVVTGRSGSIGRVFFVESDYWPHNTALFVKDFKGNDPRYIYFFLRGLDTSQYSASTAVPTLNRNNLREVTVKVPPLHEQRRIVAKLETLLGNVDACQQRLAKIPVLLKRFRQSVLAAACSGRLTGDWREETGLRFDAKADLDSHLKAAESLRPRTREAEPTEGHELITGELPTEWATPSLDDLFRFIDYRGKTPKKSESGKRLISAKNIKMGSISEEPVEYVSDDFFKKWMTRGFPKRGDIFFVTEGHTMGFTALNNRTDDFALSQRTITLQPWQPIETRTFFYFIMSPLFQKVVALNATGSAAVGIKAARFRGLPIPFPPLAEQQEIVRRVEELFVLADQIEARFTQARAQVDKLAPSLLARAFAGKLVPQDPNDEPAEKLLERIRSASP